MSANSFARAVACGATGLFAGAALGISAAGHPAALDSLDSKEYANFFQFWYPRIAKVQASLAVVGLAAAAAVAATSKPGPERALWAVSGALIGSVVPYTIQVMLPTNKTILAAAKAGATPDRSLFLSWGKMHLIRTVASVASFALMLGLTAADK